MRQQESKRERDEGRGRRAEEEEPTRPSSLRLSPRRVLFEMAEAHRNAGTTRSVESSAPSTSPSPLPTFSSAEAPSTSTVPAQGPKRPRKPRIVLEGTTDEILARNNVAAPPTFVNKLFATAGANWNRFYSHHAATPFFKDRHWTQREWPQLASLGGEGIAGEAASGADRKGKGKAVLEVGCGTGAFIYPCVELLGSTYLSVLAWSESRVTCASTAPNLY